MNPKELCVVPVQVVLLLVAVAFRRTEPQVVMRAFAVAIATAYVLAGGGICLLCAGDDCPDTPVLVTQCAHKPIVTTATKDNLRAALQLLAGRDVSGTRRSRLPQADRLHRVTPDDMLFFGFSGHGYTDSRGDLYLLPYDVGHGHEDMKDVLPDCISSADLAAWLREVDAGELVLVLDACHSAAAGAPPGFKPGPLGSRGLAQLAYDKGMRVLAASQSEQVALEVGNLRHGLLTYALVHDGLAKRGAAAQDGTITLAGWLRYAEQRVESLYTEVLEGRVRGPGNAEFVDSRIALLSRDGRGYRDVTLNLTDDDRDVIRAATVQRPELFDYARQRQEIILMNRAPP